MKKPVAASRTAFMAWSFGEPGGGGEGRHSWVLDRYLEQ